MTHHQAHISIDIPFSTVDPEDDPSELADHITRQIIQTLQYHLGYSFICTLDDVTDDPT